MRPAESTDYANRKAGVENRMVWIMMQDRCDATDQVLDATREQAERLGDF